MKPRLILRQVDIGDGLPALWVCSAPGECSAAAGSRFVAIARWHNMVAFRRRLKLERETDPHGFHVAV